MKSPVLFQRLEGLAIFAGAAFAYFYFDYSWVVFVTLLFAFDVFMIGYLFNPKIGAIVYNIGHSLIVPPLLVITSLANDSRFALGLACLWLAHVGIDRAAGYGLKLSSGFRHTHLGTIGKK